MGTVFYTELSHAMSSGHVSSDLKEDQIPNAESRLVLTVEAGFLSGPNGFESKVWMCLTQSYWPALRTVKPRPEGSNHLGMKGHGRT